MKKTISVIIPTYNREKYIEKSINSVIHQTRKPDQIIVVNDGSNDNTSNVLKKFSKIVEIVDKNNEGKSIALNTALPLVTSDYVWIMDDDDIALDFAIEVHMALLESNKNIDFTYSGFYRGYECRVNDNFLCVEKREVPLDMCNEDLFISLLGSCFIGHPAIVVKTECYRALGGFREEFYRSQDYEMLLRLARSYQGAPVKELTFICRTHQGRRGPKKFAVDVRENTETFNRFNSIFVREYYSELGLESYVTKDIRRLSSHHFLRACLVHRASIVAGHGLWDLFFKDVHIVGDCGKGSKRFTDLEKEMLTKKLYYMDFPNFYGLYEYLSNSRVDEIHPCAKKIMFFSLIRFLYYNCKKIDAYTFNCLIKCLLKIVALKKNT